MDILLVWLFDQYSDFIFVGLGFCSYRWLYFGLEMTDRLAFDCRGTKHPPQPINLS